MAIDELYGDDGAFGKSPFYAQYATPKIPDGVVAKEASTGPDQKTLDDWHYRLNRVIEDLRDVLDPIDIRKDVEEINNDIQTYLRG